MTDWRLGGITGGLNACVRREVREHMRKNVVVRRARYPFVLRALRVFFANRTFANFLLFYLAIDILVVGTEFIAARLFPYVLPIWTASGPAGTDIKGLLLNVGGYLIGAQVGVLGVISIAIGLVTLIAQREGAGTDVRLYYHEALAFEVVASSIALLLVLSVQLVWPLQFALHHLGEGTQLQLFKLILLGVHLGWLAVNLSALAYFVATTFRFVQQSAREQLRERYIANHVLPVEITARLREQLYHSAPSDLLGPAADPDHKPDRTVLYLGIDFDGSEEVEIERTFKRPFALYDVHMILLRWALRRWLRRCDDEQGGEQKKRGLGLNEPFLMFPIFLDRAMTGTVAWCLRRGGVPLDWVERVALRAAFRFRTVPDEK